VKQILSVLPCIVWSLAAAAPQATENFDAHWRFHLGEATNATQNAFDDRAWRRLDLPHDWSAELDFSPTNASGTGFLPGGIGWYRKHFSLPEQNSGEQWRLRFDGVSRGSDVWINGVHLGHRPNGYVTFEYDLTPYLNFSGADNVVAVRAARENVADSRWFPGTGIYRHVWLTRAPAIRVEPWGVQITTPRVTTEAADVVVKTTLTNGTGRNISLSLISRVQDAAGEAHGEVSTAIELKPGEAKTVADWQKLSQPQLWALESPALYRLVTELKSGANILDRVTNTFGIRTILFTADKGFFLNGTNTPIKGLCLHHDAGVLGAAVPEVVWERRLRLIKDMGANAVRTSHNPQAPEFYDLCDRIGLLVMDEAFDEWELGKRKWVKGRNEGEASRFGYASAFAEWGERDLGDMVRQHRNHPSIILWSIGNEIDYPTDPYVHPESRNDPDFAKFTRLGHPPAVQLTAIAPKLISTVKRFDTTRPVTMALANVPAANGTGLAAMLDVAGYNYQEEMFALDRKQFPHRSIIGSENGRKAENWLLIQRRGDVAGLFLWSGFDFLGEAGLWPNHGSTAGIFDTRGILKPIGWQFEALWKSEPVTKLVAARADRTDRRGRHDARSSWSWDVAPGQQMLVTAFSNGDEAELFINGNSLGRVRVAADARASWEVPYEPGELRAVSCLNGKEIASDRLVTAGAAEKIVAELEAPQPAADNRIAQVMLRVTDERGVTAPNFSLPITVTVKGGRLLALDNGDMNDPIPLRSSSRSPHDGMLFAVVQMDENIRTMEIEAIGAGVNPLNLKISTDR
jgi:hypothetical protein